MISPSPRAAFFWCRSRQTNASIANVTGTATLTGNVQTSFSPGTFPVHSYTILTADGIFGIFSSVSGNVPAGFRETPAMSAIRSTSI